MEAGVGAVPEGIQVAAVAAAVEPERRPEGRAPWAAPPALGALGRPPVSQAQRPQAAGGLMHLLVPAAREGWSSVKYPKGVQFVSI